VNSREVNVRPAITNGWVFIGWLLIG